VGVLGIGEPAVENLQVELGVLVAAVCPRELEVVAAGVGKVDGLDKLVV
jgi:hypothetical protein